MIGRRPIRRYALPWPLLAQGVLLIVGLAALVLAPPVEGPMLLLPLGGEPIAQAINAATARGARLIGTGPVRGSIVVIARRAALWRAMLGSGTLVLAASPRLCGALPVGRTA